jgi:uncharacterized protein YneF (UPF0154 family)
MQHTCPHCGFISERLSRFCRQCGTQLIEENEVTSASTRNYAPGQVPLTNPNQPNTSQQRGRIDEQTGGTSHYSPPQVEPGYQPPVQRRSRLVLWLALIALFTLLVIGGLITTGVFLADKASRKLLSKVPTNEEIQKQVQDHIGREAERIKLEVERLSEEARKYTPNNSGNVPPQPPGTVTPLTIDQYLYPRAAIDTKVGLYGNEVLRMRTRDNLDKVQKYYQKLLGNPPLQSNSAEDRTVIFQSSGTPSVKVIIQPEKEYQNQLRINVIRTSIQLPKFN